MNHQDERYSLPAPLLQAITNTLNDLPARVSRSMLNALEVECVQQDAAHAASVEAAKTDAEEAAMAEAVEAAVAARLQAMRAVAVQAPAMRTIKPRGSTPK